MATRLMFRKTSSQVRKARVSDRVEAWVAPMPSGTYRGVLFYREHPGIRRYQVGDFPTRQEAEKAVAEEVESGRWLWCV